MLGILFSSSSTYAQYFGGDNNDKAVDFLYQNQRFYLIGTTRSLGAGSEDVWLVVVNDQVEEIFQTYWGDTHFDIPAAIIKGSDGNYLISGYSWDPPGNRTDAFLTKVSPGGMKNWTSYFGGKHNDYIYNVKETTSGQYLVTGLNRDEGVEGAAALVKLGIDGDIIWQNFYDTPSKDIALDVIELSDGSLFLLTNSNTFIGKISNASEYGTDAASIIVLIKTDDMGNEIWRKEFGGTAHDFGKRIMEAPNGTYYLLSSSMNGSLGSFDIILYNLNENGDVLWEKHYGGSGYEYASSIDVDMNGNLLISGTSSSFSVNKKPDIYLIKTDEIGNVLWEKTYGTNDSDEGCAAQFLPNGDLAIFGTVTNSKGNKDWFFSTLDENGEILKTLKGDKKSNELQPMLYPNPGSGNLNIYLGDHINDEQVIVELYNTIGQLVNTFNFNAPFTNTTLQVSIGTYIYKIKTSLGNYEGKIILAE